MKAEGFSLVELILTILLLGIIAAVVPPLIPLSGQGLDAATRKVRAELVYIQQLAMITGQNHGGLFTPAGYELYRGTTATPIQDPMTKESFSEAYGARDLRRFGSNLFVVEEYQVEFDPFGRPVLGGGGTLTLSNGGMTRSILVHVTSGLVEIQ